MYAAANGHSTLGIPRSVGREFVNAGMKRARGGIVHYDDGGMIDQTPGYASNSMPTMGSPVPPSPIKRGAGPPKAPSGQNPTADPVQAVLGQIKAMDTLKNMGSKARGGMVHYDDGGSVDYGTEDAARMQNPQYRAEYERYASKTPEQLQELVTMMGPGSSQGRVANSVLQKQRMTPMAVPSTDPSQIQGYDDGGGVMSMGDAMPWWSRRQSTQVDANKSGFLKSSIPGRTDHIPTSAPAGSYVVPADVVSGLGEGNSLAGARVMQEILKSGPWGTPQEHMRGGRGIPGAPSGRTAPDTLAQGGGVDEPTKILAAGGEHLIHPTDVRRIGGGSLRRGHNVLDKWVVHERKKIAKKMLSLPGPKR